MKEPRFIVDEKGNKISVVLPIKEYNKLLDSREELEDIRQYDKVKARKEPLTKLEDYIGKRAKK